MFSGRNGKLISPELVSRRFKQLSRRANLPVIRLHDLRHTSASLALAAGVAMRVVSDRLGHSTTAITADLYTHVIPALGRDAAEAIAKSINRAAGERVVSTEPDDASSDDQNKEGA